MEMKTADFKKNVLNKGLFSQFVIYPYFSNENKMHERVMVFSDKVEEVTELKFRKKTTALILPYNEDLQQGVAAYKVKIKRYVGVDCPVFSIYDFKGQKIREVDLR